MGVLYGTALNNSEQDSSLRSLNIHGQLLKLALNFVIQLEQLDNHLPISA